MALLILGVAVKGLMQTYISYKAQIIHRLELTANKLEHSFADDIAYTSYQMEFLTNQIHNVRSDKYTIYKLLQGFRISQKTNVAISWNMFSWVNEHQFLAVDGTFGILEKPIDMRQRDYIPLTQTEPNKLHFGQPVYGAVSKQWLIPAGRGVVNHYGHYLGAVVFGFDIGSLRNKLEQLTDAEDISFILVNDKHQVLLSSTSHRYIAKSINIKALLEQAQFSRAEGMLSEQNMLMDTGIFAYYISVTDSPFTIVVFQDKASATKEFWQLVSYRIVEFGVIILILLWMAWLVKNHFVKPIQTLSDAADKITRGENNVAIPHSNIYEIDNLSEQIRNVHGYTKELRDIQATLEQRVAERTEEAFKAINVREEFLNNMSHEIRLPTSTTMALAEVLVEDWDLLPEEKKKHCAQEIQTSTKRLCSLLCNLLDIAKMKAGKMDYHMKQEDMVPMAEAVLHSLTPLCQTKNKAISLALEIEPGLSTHVWCDRMRIEQVMTNLIGNAIRYTAEGAVTVSIIGVRLESKDGRNMPGIACKVKDEGVGVPDNEIHLIFEAFTQSSKTKTGAGGTGLGLGISREIITAHHGILKAENNADGKGATFTFILPQFHQS